MFNSMEHLGKEKVKTPLFTVSIRNNAPSVNVLDEASIPKEFFIEQAPKLDKTLQCLYLEHSIWINQNYSI